MKRTLNVLCILLGLVLPILAGEQPSEWKEPLPVDPLVHRGQLPNGMKYWVRKHATPPGKVGLWIHVGSGSLNEEEAQRGLAHLLEHMAFNGTANFGPGTLVKYFESIGLEFGRDQNAFTSFDQTTYMLYLPNPKPETVAKGLLCLADYVFRQSLIPKEVDSERLVVLEESRSRKGKNQRLTDKRLPLLLPGSRVAERLPIGKEDVIRNTSRDQILAYYRKWYRPEFSTLLLVGDIEPETAEKLLTDAFKDWTAEGPTPAKADPGIKPYQATHAAVITDPELAEASWIVANVQPLREEKTLGDFRDRLIEQLGCSIVNRRFSDLLQKGQAPYQSAHCGIGTWFKTCTVMSGGASGSPERWKELLVALLTETKRACTHGFNPQELEDAKRELVAEAGQNVRTEMTRDFRAWLSRYNNTVSEDELPMSETQRARCLARILPTIALKDVEETFRASFARDGRLFLLELPETKNIAVPSEAEILAVVRQVESAQVAALAQKERPKSLLEADPDRATVKDDEWNNGLGVYSASFENNVRVHVREMSFKKSQVWAQITLPGGRLLETATSRCLADAAALAFGAPATRNFDSVQIRDFLVGKNVSVTGWAKDDALVLQIQGSPEDLEQGFQLAHLLLKEARVEAPALKTWHDRAREDWKERQSSVEAQLTEHLSLLKGGGDPRFLGWTPEMIDGVTLEKAQAFLDRHILNAPIEAAIVGDLTRFEAMDLARKYLGTLPKRPRQDGQLESLRKLNLPRGPVEETAEVDTITDKGLVVLGWRGADWRDVKDRRQLHIASQVLQPRLREEIREKRGLTYSVFAMARAGEAYPGTGFFGAYSIANPAKTAENATAAREIFEIFLRDGPTEDEMATVRKQLDNQLELQLREPTYWVGLLADLDYRGTKLSDVAEVRAQMQAYTAQEVHQTLRKYIRPERYLQVIARPKAKAETKAEGKPTEKAERK